MPIELHASSTIPLDPGVPDATRRLVGQRMARREQAWRRAAALREGRVRRLVADAGSRLRKLVGPKTLADLRALRRREARNLREAMQPPGGVTLDRAKAVRAAHARIQRLFDVRGVDRLALAKLRRDLIDRIDDLLPRHDGGPGLTAVTPAGLAAVHELMKHRWFHFEPPWEGSYAFVATSRTQSKFTVDVWHDSAPAVGQIGLNSFIGMADVGNFDMCVTDDEYGIAFWWQAPATGLVEILIEAQCGLSQNVIHQGYEWGFSDWSVSLRHSFTGFVEHPNMTLIQVAPMASVYLDGVDPVTTNWHAFVQGGVYYASLISDGVVQKGDWMVVRAGAWESDIVTVNDVTTWTNTLYRWFFRRVSVRIKP